MERNSIDNLPLRKKSGHTPTITGQAAKHAVWQVVASGISDIGRDSGPDETLVASMIADPKPDERFPSLRWFLPIRTDHVSSATFLK
jgi:hypothetical protein